MEFVRVGTKEKASLVVVAANNAVALIATAPPWMENFIFY